MVKLCSLILNQVCYLFENLMIQNMYRRTQRIFQKVFDANKILKSNNAI